MKPFEVVSSQPARQFMLLLCLIPLWNCCAAAALGAVVVYSSADENIILTLALVTANFGGWLWWMTGSLREFRVTFRKWVISAHPGFRLAGLMSLCGAISWVGVLGLLAYGMFG